MADSTFLSEKDFADFEKKVTDAANAALTKNKAVGDIPNITGKAAADKSVIETLTNGISPEKANAMLATDVVRDETAVRKTLKSCGVSKVPQNVFDGLVSMQNQLGDITYAYIGGEKIDLTSSYKAGDWDGAASLIAADERDRARRIKEAAIIVANDYGPDVDEKFVINRGLADTNELIAKSKLNAQTGDPATNQQLLAASTNYLNQTGKPLPVQDFSLSNIADTNELETLVKQSVGPWPY
jgi:GH24 family phage-related lysozyme (muramidase)